MLAEEGEALINMGAPDAPLSVEDERIGIVFPVYCLDVPRSVKRYLEQASLKASYFYTVITAGGTPGKCNRKVQYLLKQKGNALSYSAVLMMPDNCILFPSPKGRQEKLLGSQKESVGSIKQDSIAKKTEKIKSKRPYGAVTKNMWKMFFKMKKTNEKRVSEACTRCGKCAETCPTKNITVTESVHLGENCDTCFGCIQVCPQRAIAFGKLEVSDRTAYFHPDLK
jgi:ferredoxin